MCYPQPATQLWRAENCSCMVVLSPGKFKKNIYIYSFNIYSRQKGIKALIILTIGYKRQHSTYSTRSTNVESRELLVCGSALPWQIKKYIDRYF